jgi:hypothetical protein
VALLKNIHVFQAAGRTHPPPDGADMSIQFAECKKMKKKSRN